MNAHKNARLSFEGRKLLIERIAVMGLARWRQGGEDALLDRSSRPVRTRLSVDGDLALRNSSAERTAWLPSFLSYYNTRRAHSALGHLPPASRLGGNNLLQLNS